jgi:hypothetical protein
MRPGLKLLSDDLIANVVAEARSLLCTLGVEIHNDTVAAMLCDHGAASGGADARYTPSRLPDDRKAELTRLMQGEARRYGMSALPPGAN